MTLPIHNKRYLKICGVLLLLDWALGAAQAHHVVPLWTFSAANFPFGASTSGSSLTGLHPVSRWRSGAIRVVAVVLVLPNSSAQAWLYYFLLGVWLKRRADAVVT